MNKVPKSEQTHGFVPTTQLKLIATFFSSLIYQGFKLTQPTNASQVPNQLTNAL